jgi:hypothetical protein
LPLWPINAMKRLGLFCTNDLMSEDCSVSSRHPLHQVGCTVNQEDAELTVKCGVSKRWDHIHTLRSPIKLLFESKAKPSCVDIAFRYHSCMQGWVLLSSSPPVQLEWWYKGRRDLFLLVLRLPPAFDLSFFPAQTTQSSKTIALRNRKILPTVHYQSLSRHGA